MFIIIKELKKENHIYLFDETMRPLNVDIVNKRGTKKFIKNIIKAHQISGLKFMNKIDFSKEDWYSMNHI